MLYAHAGIYDPHTERRRRAETDQLANRLKRARRLEWWARRTAAVSTRLARHAGARRARLVA